MALVGGGKNGPCLMALVGGGKNGPCLMALVGGGRHQEWALAGGGGPLREGLPWKDLPCPRPLLVALSASSTSGEQFCSTMVLCFTRAQKQWSQGTVD
jgi:hypothetical protein